MKINLLFIEKLWTQWDLKKSLYAQKPVYFFPAVSVEVIRNIISQDLFEELPQCHIVGNQGSPSIQFFEE